MTDTAAPIAAISLRPTTPEMKWAGKTCPKCSQPIQPGQPAVLCPKCYTPQHAQCWRDNDNKCAIDQTPARIIERPGRAAAPAGETPTATAVALAPAVAPAARPATAVAAPAAPPADGAPTVVNIPSPWDSARPIEVPPTSDLWRRNVMTIFTITCLWGLVLLVVWALGTFFGYGPGHY